MERLMLGTAVLALWLATTGSDLAAQESLPAPGADIRLLVTPGRDVRGALVTWDADTIRLQAPGSGFVHVVPTRGIERVRVSQPRTRGRGALRGLLVGSIVGSLSIGLVALAAESSCSGFCLGPGAAFGAGAIVGGAGGGGIGAAVGATMPGKRWEDVALRP